MLLLLPQLCSARGRQALLSYALILTLTGPASNALRNARVLADSLRCGQVQCTVQSGTVRYSQAPSTVFKLVWTVLDLLLFHSILKLLTFNSVFFFLSLKFFTAL